MSGSAFCLHGVRRGVLPACTRCTFGRPETSDELYDRMVRAQRAADERRRARSCSGCGRDPEAARDWERDCICPVPTARDSQRLAAAAAWVESINADPPEERDAFARLALPAAERARRDAIATASTMPAPAPEGSS